MKNTQELCGRKQAGSLVAWNHHRGATISLSFISQHLLFPFLFPYFPLPPWPTVFHRGCLGKHSPLPVHDKGLKRPLTSICEGFLKRDQDVRSPKQTELSTKGRCQHVLCRFRQAGFDEFWFCHLLAVWAVIYHLIGPNTYLIKFLKVASIL